MQVTANQRENFQSIYKLVKETHGVDPAVPAGDGYLDLKIFKGENGKLMTRVFRKPNEIVQFINTRSSHQKKWLINNAKACRDRIMRICSCFEFFQQDAKVYIEALKSAGHRNVDKIFKVDQKEYAKERTNLLVQPIKEEKKRGKRKIFLVMPWSPYYKSSISKGVKEIFSRHLDAQTFQLIRHRINIVFSRTATLGQMIQGHNNAVLKRQSKDLCSSNEVLKSIANEECNCRKKNGFRQCAYQGKCNKSGVYKISLVDANESLKQVYIGSTGRFKERFSKHDTRAASADSIVAKNMKLNMEWKCVKEILYVMYIGGKACTICHSEKFEIFEYRPPDPTVMFFEQKKRDIWQLYA